MYVHRMYRTIKIVNRREKEYRDIISFKFGQFRRLDPMKMPGKGWTKTTEVRRREKLVTQIKSGGSACPVLRRRQFLKSAPSAPRENTDATKNSPSRSSSRFPTAALKPTSLKGEPLHPYNFLPASHRCFTDVGDVIQRTFHRTSIQWRHPFPRAKPIFYHTNL